MPLIDVIAESKAEYEIYFLLTAYLESVRFCDKFRLLPDHITGLPLKGPADLRRRYEDLASELTGNSVQFAGRPAAIIKEALDVFSTGLCQLKRMETDEARPKTDIASRPMSVESRNAFEAYKVKRAIACQTENTAADAVSSLQTKAERTALKRKIRRLELAEARLKADTCEEKKSAESPDAEKEYRDKQAVNGERKDIKDAQETLGRDKNK